MLNNSIIDNTQMVLKKIGISLRITNAINYDESRDSISHDWPQFLVDLGFYPVLIPNKLFDLESFLDSSQLDGIILSGGDNLGDTPLRDKTEKEIIDYSIDKQIPIFGVCRGMQLLNNYFGGNITNSTSEEHLNKPHKVAITSPKLTELLGNQITVNSFHRNLITESNLGENLEILAKVDSDKTVEAFLHKQHRIMGVMWHPERTPDENNRLILNTFFTSNN